MLIKLHSSDHRAVIHQMRDQSEAWLAERGIEQYQVGPRAANAHDALDAVFDRGEFYGWLVGGTIVAVAALTTPDLDFWTPAEAAQPATYLGRFMTSDHGQGHGSAMLEALAEHARQSGYQALRLDCWKSNTELQAYYQHRGFRHVRTVEVPDRLSGALFERCLNAVIAAAVVVSSHGLLVARRRDQTPPWTLIAGKVKPTEQTSEAAIREVKEETGIEVRPSGELGRRIHPKTDRLLVYLAASPANDADTTHIAVGDQDELDDVRWISRNDIPTYLPDLYDPVLQHLVRVMPEG